MFDASQPIVVRCGTNVYCNTIEEVYEKFNGQTIYTPTTEEVTWKPVAIKRKEVFDAKSLVYRLHFDNGTDVIVDKSHMFDGWQSDVAFTEYDEPDHAIKINEKPFFNAIDTSENYADGFFVGMYTRGGKMESDKIVIETSQISLEVGEYVREMLRRMRPIRYTDTMISCNGLVGVHEIVVDNTEHVKYFTAFINNFITDSKPNLNAILYNQNFRRGVLDGIRLFDHTRFDADFSIEKTKSSEEWMVDLIQSLAVSLGYAVVVERYPRSTKMDIATSSMDSSHAPLKIQRIVQQTPTNEFGYDIDPEGEMINGSIILPNGILSNDHFRRFFN